MLGPIGGLHHANWLAVDLHGRDMFQRIDNRFARNLSWYTPSKGGGKALGRLTFLSEGATPGNGTVENWFELLSSWFPAPAGGSGAPDYQP